MIILSQANILNIWMKTIYMGSQWFNIFRTANLNG